MLIPEFLGWKAFRFSRTVRADGVDRDAIVDAMLELECDDIAVLGNNAEGLLISFERKAKTFQDAEASADRDILHAIRLARLRW